MIQKIHFCRNILEFFLGCITIFDPKISGMKDKVYKTQYNPIWIKLTSVPLKILITQYQDRLSLRNMGGNDMRSIK